MPYEVVSKIHLVDLAGRCAFEATDWRLSSATCAVLCVHVFFIHPVCFFCVFCSERADPQHKYNKGVLKEASSINKSLVTLGNVIVALGMTSLASLSAKV